MLRRPYHESTTTSTAGRLPMQGNIHDLRLTPGHDSKITVTESESQEHDEIRRAASDFCPNHDSTSTQPHVTRRVPYLVPDFLLPCRSSEELPDLQSILLAIDGPRVSEKHVVVSSAQARDHQSSNPTSQHVGRKLRSTTRRIDRNQTAKLPSS